MFIRMLWSLSYNLGVNIVYRNSDKILVDLLCSSEWVEDRCIKIDVAIWYDKLQNKRNVLCCMGIYLTTLREEHQLNCLVLPSLELVAFLQLFLITLIHMWLFVDAIIYLYISFLYEFLGLFHWSRLEFPGIYSVAILYMLFGNSDLYLRKGLKKKVIFNVEFRVRVVCGKTSYTSL